MVGKEAIEGGANADKQEDNDGPKTDTMTSRSSGHLVQDPPCFSRKAFHFSYLYMCMVCVWVGVSVRESTHALLYALLTYLPLMTHLARTCVGLSASLQYLLLFDLSPLST